MMDLNSRLNRLGDGPFDKLKLLLDGVSPTHDKPSIDLSLGEPHHVFPSQVARIISEREGEWGRYPPLNGSAELRQSIVNWLARRYSLTEGSIDPDRHVLALSGSREGIFLVSQVVVPSRLDGKELSPVVLVPNPFYAAYAGSAVGADAEPVFVNANEENNNLPDFTALPEETLDRTVLCFLCSPANPQGSVADISYLATLIRLARKHNFLLAVDECYGELYDVNPPPGALEVCQQIGGGFKNVLVFHTLSKRSSVPGLRSAFVCGDPELIASFARLRSYCAATSPGPINAAAAALWADDDHVAEARNFYRARFDQSERILSSRFDFHRPDATFFLWLDVCDGEEVACRLWSKAALKVMPGSYLAQGIGKENPGDKYIRVALIENEQITQDALTRIVGAV